jgi:hypothetical protein
MKRMGLKKNTFEQVHKSFPVVVNGKFTNADAEVFGGKWGVYDGLKYFYVVNIHDGGWILRTEDRKEAVLLVKRLTRRDHGSISHIPLKHFDDVPF